MRKLIWQFITSVGETLHAALFNYMARNGMVLCTISLPNGSVVAIAASYGTSKTISAITNADPGVMQLETGHGIITGDLMEITSGWSRLTDKIVRAGTVGSPPSVDEIPLEGIDTSSTTTYPAAAGTGTMREVLTWTNLTQILQSSSSGGEQQFLEYQLLEADAQKRIPTFKSAAGLTFSVADDPTLAGYILASTANDDRLARAIRVTLPSGALIFYNAYVSLNKTPSLDVNQIMAVQVTLSLLAEPVRYTS